MSVRSHTSKVARPNFTKFLCMLPVAVARSSSVGVAIRYVLPVLPQRQYTTIEHEEFARWQYHAVGRQTILMKCLVEFRTRGNGGEVYYKLRLPCSRLFSPHNHMQYSTKSEILVIIKELISTSIGIAQSSPRTCQRYC